MKVSEIEIKVGLGEMTAAQVFTQMKQHIIFTQMKQYIVNKTSIKYPFHSTQIQNAKEVEIKHLTTLQVSKHNEIKLTAFDFKGKEMLALHIKNANGISAVTATPDEIVTFLTHALEAAKLRQWLDSINKNR